MIFFFSCLLASLFLCFSMVRSTFIPFTSRRFYSLQMQHHKSIQLNKLDYTLLCACKKAYILIQLCNHWIIQLEIIEFKEKRSTHISIQLFASRQHHIKVLYLLLFVRLFVCLLTVIASVDGCLHYGFCRFFI